MGNKDILLNDGTVLPCFPKKSANYIDKTIIIYGKRGSGKSTVIDDIMYTCKHVIPSIYVISRTAIANNQYKDKIPNNCVKGEVSKEWLANFVKSQSERAAIYKRANDIKLLETVFLKINDKRAVLVEQMIKSKTENIIKDIKKSDMNHAKKKESILEIEKLNGQKIYRWYKDVIRANIIKLEEMKKVGQLTRYEICVVDFLDFNPRVMLILEDCAPILKEFCKDKSVKDIFYNGRWFYITMIITSQADKEIDSNIRENVDVNIFTKNTAATANFDRSANHYSKTIKKYSEKCIDRVFQTEISGGENHKKLIYLSKTDEFFYSIADYPLPAFKMGCPALWRADDKISVKRGDSEPNIIDEFFEKYYQMT